MKVLPEFFTIVTNEAPRFPVKARDGFSLKQHLIDKDITFRTVQGVYGGISETSYLIPLTGAPYQIERKQKQIELLASLLGQAAVFHWEAGKRGVLVFTNGDDKHKWLISKQHKVSDAKPSGDYTRIGNIYLQVSF